MYEPFEEPKEPFLEKYAIIPFFMAVASLTVGYGYVLAKATQEDIQEDKKYEMRRHYPKKEYNK